MSDIVSSEDSDYKHRAVADREAVMAAMAQLAADIRYDNFKDEVASLQGYKRTAIYGRVWHDLFRLQTDQLDEQQPIHPTML